MIQGLIPVAPSAPEVPMTPPTPAVPGKSFSSVLKTTVQNNKAKPDNDGKTKPADAGAAKDASGPADGSSAKVSGIKTARETADDAPVVKDAKDPRSDKQDPNEILRQLVLQMSALAQQLINQPALKNVNSLASPDGAFSADASHAMQSALMPLMSDAGKENALQSQAAPGAAATVQGGNFLAALAVNQDSTADKIDFKLPDKFSANSKDALFGAPKGSQNDLANSIPPAADSAKSEAELQSFSQAGKDAAFLSKTSGPAGDGLAQFKIESSDGPSAGQVLGDRNDVRDASGLSAQNIQGQNTSSAHEQSPIQGTVPANRLASLDAVISKAVDSGQKNLVIRIDPPDLGSMHIRLSLDNGVLKADVRVDSGAIKDSFNLALPQIKTSLENAGIKVSDFHVDVREDQYKDGQERNNQGQQQQRQSRGLKKGFSDFFA